MLPSFTWRAQIVLQVVQSEYYQVDQLENLQNEEHLSLSLGGSGSKH